LLSVRRHAISRICSLWLIALILIPFTAPFRTFDLAGSTSHSYDGLPKDKVDSDDKLAALGDTTLPLPSRDVIVATPFVRVSQLQGDPLQVTVLRL